MMLDAKPFAQLDSCSQWWQTNLRADMDAFVDGRIQSPTWAHAREIGLLENIVVDERASEGFHRSTNHTKSRCPAQSRERILADQRFHQTMSRSKKLVEDGSEIGNRVFLFEWATFKCLVQASVFSYKTWRARRMDDRTVFRKMYRLDDSALEDFSM